MNKGQLSATLMGIILIILKIIGYTQYPWIIILLPLWIIPIIQLLMEVHTWIK